MTSRPLLASVIAIAIAIAAAPSAAEADDDPLWPQLSYSVAVGRSDGAALGHMWVGAGAHVATGQFVLIGADIDFRDTGSEVWLVGRVGQGAFKDRALAPLAAMYLIGGARRDRLRVGAGVSAPAALQLARIGIPTMIEAGVDLSPGGDERRYFTRLGWNF